PRAAITADARAPGALVRESRTSLLHAAPFQLQVSPLRNPPKRTAMPDAAASAPPSAITDPAPSVFADPSPEGTRFGPLPPSIVGTGPGPASCAALGSLLPRSCDAVPQAKQLPARTEAKTR